MKKAIAQDIHLETNLSDEAGTHPVAIICDMNGPGSDQIWLTYREAKVLQHALERHLDHLSRCYAEKPAPKDGGE